MPWSNQGGGGRKGGGNGGGPWGQGPWGSGGGGGGNQPPDLDEILRRGQDKVKRVMRGGGGGGPGGGVGEGGVPRGFLFFLGIIASLLAAFFVFTFRVNPDEQGIVLRFGKFDHWEGPGLHFRMPYPVEEVPDPEGHAADDHRDRRRPLEHRNAGAESQDSGLMLTGDGSVIDMHFKVFWRIKQETDPVTGQMGVEQYLFNIAPARGHGAARSRKAPCAKSSARPTCSRC